ncbi:MAG: ABC transporter substrate-binding protein [Microvirga sp.]|nr:ABC transporter substrate-binding protein [Microvirga sp.]
MNALTSIPAIGGAIIKAGLGAALITTVMAGLSAEAQTPALKPGGTVVAAINGDPPVLNTIFGADVLAVTLSGQIHDTLITLDQQLNAHPALAESWEISADGLTYTFNLRENVKWHDGAPFTAEDVRYSFLDLLPKHNSLAEATFSAVESIDTPDDHTVIVKLKGVDPAFFPWAFSQTNFGQIYPKHIYEGTDAGQNPANFAPIGTGPFKFREWARGSHITLERNPDYFEPVNLERVVFQIIPEPGARQVALERGDIDYLPYFALAPSAIDPLSSHPDTEVIDAMRPPQGEIIMFINQRSEPLSDVRVRKALAHAIDREQIVDLALDGRAIPGSSPIRSDNPLFYNPDVEKYPRDVARANALLDEAGFARGADGQRFTLRLAFQANGEGGALQSAAEIIREQAREIGVQVELTPSDAATWQERSFIQWDFDLTMGSFGTGPDPAIGVARLYITENIVQRNASNLTGYSNPKVDELFAQGAVEIDPEARKRIYQEVQAILVDELPAIWLWEKFYPIAVRRGLVGMPSGAMHSEPWHKVGWAE